MTELLRALHHIADKVQELVMVSGRLMEAQARTSAKLEQVADRCQRCLNYEPTDAHT